jgi:hypothetical protein
VVWFQAGTKECFSSNEPKHSLGLSQPHLRETKGLCSRLKQSGPKADRHILEGPGFRVTFAAAVESRPVISWKVQDSG